MLNHALIRAHGYAYCIKMIDRRPMHIGMCTKFALLNQLKMRHCLSFNHLPLLLNFKYLTTTLTWAKSAKCKKLSIQGDVHTSPISLSESEAI